MRDILEKFFLTNCRGVKDIKKKDIKNMAIGFRNTLAAVTANEVDSVNSYFLGQFVATADDSRAGVSYSLESDGNPSYFTINASTGQLYIRSSFDHESFPGTSVNDTKVVQVVVKAWNKSAAAEFSLATYYLGARNIND